MSGDSEALVVRVVDGSSDWQTPLAIADVMEPLGEWWGFAGAGRLTSGWVE